MKKWIAVLALIVLLCVGCAAVAEETPKAEILAIYSCPETQIITGDDQSKELADTVVFLYQDYSYIQYVNHDNQYEIYSNGTFEANFDWTKEGWQYEEPHILTVHVQQLHAADHSLEPADFSYDINLERVTDFCLYPDNLRTELKLVAAFMQVDKQKLAIADGSEEYLPTMWFYYDNGTFEQYALIDGHDDVLFSSGDYSITDPAFSDVSVLTLHRTQKYQDGKGLSDYDSNHDYVIGELGFIRIFPN